MGKLTDKQKLFVEEYLVDNNATQAAIRAGYSKKTAYSSGQRLLKNVEVKALLEERQAKTIEKLEITREDILKRLDERSRLMKELQILASKDTLSKEETSKYYRLKEIIKMSDANKSDEMIARMLGFNEPDKVDVTIKEFKADFGN